MPQIEIDGLNIHYVEKGKGQPLIFLHATFIDSSAYPDFIDILSQNHKVYAIDFPFHGKSDKHKEKITLFDFADLLRKFIKFKKVRNPIICAHSGGAIVGIIYASKYRTKELVLISPAGAKVFKSFAEFVFRIVFIKTPICFIRHPLNSIKLNLIGLKNILRNIFNKNLWSLIKSEIQLEYSEQMRKISCPTRLFFAKNDHIIPKKLSKKFLFNISRSKLSIVNAGHDWIILKPELIRTYLL